MKKLIFLFIGILFYSNVYAEVSQFVFVTEPQSIDANSLSETITIQSQNSSGEQEDITETMDLVFSSTSATPEFLSTSGNPVSTTMSKNTSNKNFLYRDATSGTYIITIQATGRTSLKTITTSQQVVVGGSSNTPNNTPNATTTEETVTPTPTPTPTTQTNYSAHSSPSPLSNTENKMEFEVSAGRDRLTSTGSSVLFVATPTKLQNVSKQSISYSWSFGDGTTAKGETASHYYRHPGEYSVVLNAFSSDKQAVSRLTVKVVSPDISIIKVPDGSEVENKSGAEINLGNWKISGNNKVFVIPEDTLIPSGKKIIFSDDVTGINTVDLSLINPTSKTVASSVSFNEDLSLSSKQISLSEIQDKINEVKSVLSTISPQETKTIKRPQVASAPVEKTVPVDSGLVITEESQTASAIQVFEASKKSGVVSSLFSWPMRGLSFIKHIFTEE